MHFLWFLLNVFRLLFFSLSLFQCTTTLFDRQCTEPKRNFWLFTITFCSLVCLHHFERLSGAFGQNANDHKDLAECNWVCIISFGGPLFGDRETLEWLLLRYVHLWNQAHVYICSFWSSDMCFAFSFCKLTEHVSLMEMKVTDMHLWM